MSYLQALEKKGISIEQLPKSTQKEISELERLSIIKQEIDSEDGLDEDELKNLADVNLSLKFLEESVVRKINRFDPEKYAKKLEKVKMMNKSRNVEQKETKVEEKVSKEETKEVSQVSKVIQFDNDKIQKNLEEVKKSVQVDTSKFKVEQQVVEEEKEEAEPEIEEFEKKENVKPNNKKRMGFLWVGLGMLLTIYGVKNIFSKQ
jgi:hypothetical protein